MLSGAGLVSSFSPASAARTQCLDWAEGHTSAYSWTSDGNLNCSTIQTRAYSWSGTGYSWTAWAYDSDNWVQREGNSVLGHDGWGYA